MQLSIPKDMQILKLRRLFTSEIVKGSYVGKVEVKLIIEKGKNYE